MTNKLIPVPKGVEVKSSKLYVEQTDHLTYSRYFYLVDDKLTTKRVTLKGLNKLLKGLSPKQVRLVEQEEGERVHAFIKDDAEKKAAKAAAERKRKAEAKKKEDEKKKKEQAPDDDVKAK